MIETKTMRLRRVTNSLRLALEAVARCRELLINADADADDLAEYDAATQALRYTLDDCLEGGVPVKAHSPNGASPAAGNDRERDEHENLAVVPGGGGDSSSTTGLPCPQTDTHTPGQAGGQS